ncbi:hypothetical protein OROHE_023181 [Orobanche hederae]
METLKVFHFTIFLVISSTLARSEQIMMNSRKLDETTPDLQNKCGGCPCNNPCNPSPPPQQPSPPPPSPPPPSLPPPAPKKPQPSNYCPPPPIGGGGESGQSPPSAPYIYINGPPQNLYPVGGYYSGSGRIFSTGLIPFLIGSALGFIAFW